MTRYPVNRRCPLTGEAASRVLAYVPASAVAAGNPTYRPNYAEILGISPDDEFPFVEDPSGFVYAGWLPPDDFLRSVYEDVIDHSKTFTETIEYRQSLLEFGAVFLREAAGGSTVRPLRLLDYGCGYGALARMIASRDIQCFGYDPSNERRTRASEGGLHVFGTLQQTAASGPFDLFILTEVLEHVPNPREVLRFIKQHASPSALLALTVPQCEPSFIASSFSSFLKGGQLPRVINPWEHLNYFSAQTLRNILKAEGLKPVIDYNQEKQACTSYFNALESLQKKDFIRAANRLRRALFVRGQTTQVICRNG
jgi:2-polyprenyl-3-methyl-5-hydroxy-6-metoxy-1,4-benzoquinol methylase